MFTIDWEALAWTPFFCSSLVETAFLSAVEGADGGCKGCLCMAARILSLEKYRIDIRNNSSCAAIPRMDGDRLLSIIWFEAKMKSLDANCTNINIAVPDTAGASISLAFAAGSDMADTGRPLSSSSFYITLFIDRMKDVVTDVVEEVVSDVLS
jgi:hypothetical protein